MDSRRYHSGRSSGFQYEKLINQRKEIISTEEEKKYSKRVDDDLIIEDNTIYEIDRECYERSRKQKKRKE